MIRMNLRVIGRVVLGLSILIMCGAIGSGTAWADVLAAYYFPLAIGNSWKYLVRTDSNVSSPQAVVDQTKSANGVKISSNVSILDAIVDRTELVNGLETFVVRDFVNSVVTGEDNWSIGSGIRWHKTFVVDGVEINGTKLPVTTTFDPPIPLTNPTLQVNEIVVMTGNFTAELGVGGVAGTINGTYNSSFKVEQVGTTAVAPAGIFLGGRITGTLGLTAPTMSATGSFDWFLGEGIGPVQRTIEGFDRPTIHKKLKDTNLINVNTITAVATLPDIRANTTDNLISGAATAINAGDNECVDGRVGIDPDSWKLGKLGIDFFFGYFKANQQNQITDGTINPTVNIPAGGQQQYVWFANARSEFTKDFQIAFACKNSFRSAFNFANDLRVTYKFTPMLDIPTFVKTVDNDGYMRIPENGIGIAAAATVNLGNKSDVVTVAFKPVDPSIPFWGRICMTDQAGACFGVPAESVQVSYGIGETHSFGLFGIYMGDIADDPAVNRGKVVATDADGNEVGGADLAVFTIPFSF